VQNSHRRVAENYTLGETTFLVQEQPLNYSKSILWQILSFNDYSAGVKIQSKILRHSELVEVLSLTS